MKSQHDIEHEQGGGPPASPSLSSQDTAQEASGPPMQVFPHPPARPPRSRGKLWMVLGAVLLALALLASLGVLLLPGLLQRPAAPARPTATLPAATTPATAVPATPGQTVTPAPATTATTVPMPPTQTSCPPAGTARAAVMAPLVRGSHPNVVYVENQWEANNPDPTAGMLKRYDTVTGRTTVIATGSRIDEAQVSADGQWVLFSSTISHRSDAIQLVRIDGQGLQTLYCSSSSYGFVAHLEWSPDQQYLAFKDGMDNVYLLTVTTGAYRLEVPRPSNSTAYVPVTWLDTTHLYLTPYRGMAEPLLNVSLLDIKTAKVQPVLASPTFVGDFDSSIDGTRLFSSECAPGYPGPKGPSSIRVQPATGGPATTIYRTPTYAIRYLRVASRTTLLFLIHNSGIDNVDRSHNGLWKINTDGTGLSRLTTDPAGRTEGEGTWFNSFTQYVWSTVSRDGSMYAVERGSIGIPSSLLIGSLSGGAPLTVATGVKLVGWTTL